MTALLAFGAGVVVGVGACCVPVVVDYLKNGSAIG